ncbi:metallophosphoesterase family protein [Adhaeribacter radiodurans]|uniref:Serine/threonine protein phosphatase n=1 Tax=Adhaeribacter radiodurans TaxID=2745197 RepID=A0A7L7LFG6_9BACT|nr:metallophosphoesterase family protein [Adhaeribacter radiodurans]QMU31255.1 serine/threonine protein phosphatase [Adhaeribacter radiodurans]
MSRYAISDMHGCAKTFRYLVEESIKLQPTDQLFLLGDYIDRGPDTKGVIDFILELRAKGIAVTTLMGNHELMLLESLESDKYLLTWLRNGGQATLASFNVQQVTDIPVTYLNFFNQLDFFTELDDYLLVHAGFNFQASNPFTDYESMVWIRNFKLDKQFTNGRRIVHGHTPTGANQIKHSVTRPIFPVINIDGGCVYSRPSGLGKLVALNLDTLEITMEDYREDV